jgi:hypothetical protein
VDEVINGGEFFIHHEDLLRGVPGFERRRLDGPPEAVAEIEAARLGLS